MNAGQQDLAELIVIDPKDALTTFTTAGALDPILKIVRDRIDAFESDVSTATGRKQIASMAFAVSKSKTALEAVGEKLAKEAKELPKKIDAGRKYARDKLDAWRDEVRKPLDEWEAQEEARKDRHLAALADMKSHAGVQAGTSSERLREVFSQVSAISDGPEREEFADEFVIARSAVLRTLDEALSARLNYEAEQEELAKLRAEKSARDAKEAEDRRIAEAKATEGKRIAEEAARVKAQEEAITAAQVAAAERERLAAEKRAADEREAAARRETDLKAKAEASERRAREAEERAAADAQEAKISAERAAQEAVAKAQREAEAKAAAERAEQERREHDRTHRGKVNRDAVAAFVAHGIAEETAKEVVSLIAKKIIPAVAISY